MAGRTLNKRAGGQGVVAARLGMLAMATAVKEQLSAMPGRGGGSGG